MGGDESFRCLKKRELIWEAKGLPGKGRGDREDGGGARVGDASCLRRSGRAAARRAMTQLQRGGRRPGGSKRTPPPLRPRRRQTEEAQFETRRLCAEVCRRLPRTGRIYMYICVRRREEVNRPGHETSIRKERGQDTARLPASPLPRRQGGSGF